MHPKVCFASDRTSKTLQYLNAMCVFILVSLRDVGASIKVSMIVVPEYHILTTQT